VIPFIGLKVGVHEFDFEIREKFFEDLEYSIIHSGDVHVHLSLEKKETMLIGVFTISGTVHTNCDRCNDPLEVPVKGTYQLIFKFGHEREDDESLVVLHPDAYEIDLQDPIYEFITVSMPTRVIHAQGECNEEMIALLREYSHHPDEQEENLDEEDEDWEDDDEWDEDEDWEDDDDDDDDPVDPRWSALKNLN
jgi:uncharacterized metal-binding protein YceD (DUF177 family)